MRRSGLSTKATESSDETDKLGRPSATNLHACCEKAAAVGAHHVGIGVGLFPEPCNFKRCAVHAVTVKLDLAITSKWGDECRVHGAMHTVRCLLQAACAMQRRRHALYNVERVGRAAETLPTSRLRIFSSTRCGYVL